MILRREIRMGFRYALIWTLATALVLVTLLLMYPSLEAQQATILAALDAVNPSLSASLGLSSGFAAGMSAFHAQWVTGLQLLLGALYALLLGAPLLCREQEDATADFTFTGPTSRAAVVLSKLSALFLYILLYDALLIATCALTLYLLGEAIRFQALLMLGGGLLLAHLELGALSLAVSSMCERRRPARAISILLGLALLLIGAFARFDPRYSFLLAASPFARGAQAAAGMPWPQFAVGIGVTAVAMAWTLVQYQRKNIRAN